MNLSTLAREELYAYLCVHGATHAWSRLKWLADLAALLKDEGDEGVVSLHRRALELGAGRTSAQALLLCSELLELALPVELERQLRSDRGTAALLRVARKSLWGGGSRELDDTIFGTVRIHLSHLRLIPGWRFKGAELRRKFAGPTENGVGGSRFGPLLAAPLWLLRRARHARPKARDS